MAWRGFYLTTPPKSVTYVLNLLCIRCPEPAPSFAREFVQKVRTGFALFSRTVGKGNFSLVVIQS
jgi:hypothetical protein